MACLICGLSPRDGISKEVIREMTGVEMIQEFLKGKIVMIWRQKRMDNTSAPVKANILLLMVQRKADLRDEKNQNSKRHAGSRFNFYHWWDELPSLKELRR